MIDKDFKIYNGKDDGYKIVREISAGAIPYLKSKKIVFLINKIENPEVFYFPKGHLRVIDNYVEDPLKCAMRETKEEFFWDDSIKMNFNGFYASAQKETIFKKTSEHSYKRILFFGCDIDANLDFKEKNLPNGRILKTMTVDQALECVYEGYREVLEEFRGLAG